MREYFTLVSKGRQTAGVTTVLRSRGLLAQEARQASPCYRSVK
ncbi:hypothetical protein SBV1_820003 [Verrucomicrobia bacterium]|nr:hypothetical protein SBV1_820003 [Verrucomicrobiota bacterium]